MKIILIGIQGAGKSTQGNLLSGNLKIPYLSTGHIFRDLAKEHTPEGRYIKETINAGYLLPDDKTLQVVSEYLHREEYRNGYILDGFPRTIAQADALAGFSELDAAVDFEVRDDLILFRLTGRRVCRSCGAIYHQVTKKPIADGVCDLCGGELYTRSDDREETVKTRLKAYHDETEPLIGYYADRGLLLKIDGSPDAETVYNAFISEIGRFLKK